MMQSLFLSYIQNEISLSLLILILLLISPILAQYYKAKSRYYMWLIPLLALIIPYNLLIDRPLWQINIRPILHYLPLSEVQEQFQPDDLSTPSTKETLNESYMSYADSIALIPTPSTQSIDSDSIDNNSIGHISTLPTITQHNRSTIEILVSIWFIGFILSISYILLSHIRFIRYTRKWCEPIKDPQLLSIIQNLRTYLNLNSKLKVQYCKILNSPITVGLIHPIILLPCIPFDEQEITLLLSHEMIHCKRKDIYYKTLVSFVQALHWYNPIIYLMKNRIYFECETSCDECVLTTANEDTRLQYGEIIIDMIRQPNVKGSTLSSAFFIEKKKIKERLSGIMNNKIKQNGKLMITCIAVIMTLSSVLVGFTNTPVPSKNNSLTLSNKTASPSTTHNTLVFNGSIAPQLTCNLCTLTMKKGEAITYSLQNKMTDSMGQLQADTLTILSIDSQSNIHQMQLNNQNTTATFVADKDNTYLMTLQNSSTQLLNYSIQCTTTSQNAILDARTNPNFNINMPTSQPQNSSSNTSIKSQSNQMQSINNSLPINNTNNINNFKTPKTSPQVTDDKTAQSYYENTGNMADIVNHLDVISEATLDAILIDYIEKTDDIGMLFTCVDHVSQNTIDTIMISYIKRTNDIGMLFSALDYLSQSAIDQIAKNYAATQADSGMLQTIKPYVSKGVL